MIAEVVFPLAHPGTFFYFIPERSKLTPGVRVLASLKGKDRMGFVVSVREDCDTQFELKEIKEVLDESPLIPEKLIELLKWISFYYKEPLGIVFSTALPPYIRQGKSVDDISWGNLAVFLKDKTVSPEIKLTRRQKDLLNLLVEKKNLFLSEIERVWGISRSVVYALKDKGLVDIKLVPKEANDFSGFTEDIVLNSYQKKSIEEITTNMGRFCRMYLYGVTGSGKTEVYKRCAEVIISYGKGAIILVPEIALTPHYIKRFISVFKDKLSVLHSGLSPKERAYQWKRIREGKALIVVGTRSAIFSPIKDCGLIVVDEEHDVSYKQMDSPRYNARDVAIVRAKIENCPVVLGSATPSVESYFNIKRGKFHFLSLPKRISDAPPPDVFIVDMKSEKNIFSELLISKIKDALDERGCIMLLLNKKGYSRSVLCKHCGSHLCCPNCDVIVTPHKDDQGFFYVCHWCGYTVKAFSVCPFCKRESLIMVGYGLQRVQEKLKSLFPDKVIYRMDKDTVNTKYAYWKILDEMEKGKIDILIGTQMIAKGHHFPNVILSALLLADIGLNIPDFRASERIYQLICQMAGRCGRGSKKGSVVIQTFNPEYYAIKFGASCDLDSFMKIELANRKDLNFPPFSFMARLIFVGSNEERVKEASYYVKDLLKGDLEIIGPSPSGIRKIKNKFRWHIILRSVKRTTIQKALDSIPQSYRNVRIYKDVDPYEFI